VADCADWLKINNFRETEIATYHQEERGTFLLEIVNATFEKQREEREKETIEGEEDEREKDKGEKR
jgi:hypothetical protein